MDGGKMDGWQNAGGCAGPAYSCITYWPASAQPSLTALAGTYGVADMAFTQAGSPSWGGHLNLLAGTTDHFTGDNPHPRKGVTAGPGWGCDSRKVAPWVTPSGGLMTIPSCVPDPALGPDGGAFRVTPAAHVPTIMDEMDAASPPVSWNIYSALAGQKDFGYGWAGCPSFADCLYTGQVTHMVADSQFFTDAAAGTLPAVSFVMPHIAVSQHNLQSNAAGDNWIGQVASAVMNSPDWASTALIITYDDCGCFYDHVPPPLAPDGRQEGPRVPFVVVSPWAVPGFTDSTPTTSTGSILAFIESTFGLPALNVNDGGAYNLAGMFNFAASSRLAHPRMVQRKLPAAAYRVNPAAASDGT
jgi:phospholipase C